MAGQLAAAEPFLSQGLALLTRWTEEGFAVCGERQRIRLLARQGGAPSAYLSVAPAAGIKAEETYGHVVAWKGVVEARQDEERLARDWPELKETLGQLEQACARLAHLAFTTPSPGHARPGPSSSTRFATARKTWKVIWLATAPASGRFGRSGGWERPRRPRLYPRGLPRSTCCEYAHHTPPQASKGPLRPGLLTVSFWAGKRSFRR